MSSTVCVAFGSVSDPAVWAADMPQAWTPMLGMRTQFQVQMSDADEEDGEMAEIISQVVFCDVQEDGSPITFIFGGNEVPDEDIMSRFEDNSWVRLPENAAREILQIIETAPPVASTHDIVLIVGDPSKIDENGNVEYEIWNRILAPNDPLLPMFGQQLLLDVVDSMPDSEVDVELPTEQPGEDKQTFRDRVRFFQGVNMNTVGSAIGGLPVSVIYCAQVEPGVAQIAFWAKDLGSIDGYDLLAADWALMGEGDDFDVDEFRVTDRILLAEKTFLDIRVDDSGEPFLSDFEIRDAAKVAEDQYSLLPPALAEHCRFAKELEQTDDIVRQWSDEDPSKEN